MLWNKGMQISSLAWVAAVCGVAGFGCDDSSSAAAPSSPAASSSIAEKEEPVNSGDENGPAITKPLEEPPVPGADDQSEENPR